jgi:hypothetical protein
MATTTTAMAAPSMTSEQISEKGEKLSLIQSLTTRIQDLSNSIETWNNWYIAFVAATVVLAALVFTAQFAVIRKSKRLANTQNELMAEKDRLASADSQAKDVEIAEAKQKAGEAILKAAALEKETAVLKKAAEDERLARVKIEERIAWRRVPPMLHGDFVNKLTPFAGSAVALNPLGNGDPETDTFAGDIAKLMHDSHWRTQISTGNIAIPAPQGLICRVDESSPAGKALVEVLGKLPGAVIIPTSLNGIVAAITIGLRPPP